MNKPQFPKRAARGDSGSSWSLGSCILATLFLIFVVIIGFIIYLSLFNTKHPNITVNAVKIPSFTVGNGSASFTFSEYVSINNPNTALFSHEHSTLQLLYSGNQVGFMYLPAGKVAGGQTQYMDATFAVKSIPVAVPVLGDGIKRISPAMEMESRMEVGGRVRILHFFTHRVIVTVHCRIVVAVNDGSVLHFHC